MTAERVCRLWCHRPLGHDLLHPTSCRKCTVLAAMNFSNGSTELQRPRNSLKFVLKWHCASQDSKDTNLEHWNNGLTELISLLLKFLLCQFTFSIYEICILRIARSSATFKYTNHQIDSSLDSAAILGSCQGFATLSELTRMNGETLKCARYHREVSHDICHQISYHRAKQDMYKNDGHVQKEPA
jgi:hypothetical protein